MTKHRRGNIWLAAAGLVTNSQKQWLVVKKRYGGLYGKWSLPAGFVMANETIDQAAIREVKEETGIDCALLGMIGFRTGVIREEISDNMAIFLLTAIDESQPVKVQLSELYEAAWLSPDELAKDEAVSVMLQEMVNYVLEEGFQEIEDVNPGDIFGYSTYKLFFKK
ncbi:NUDIX hydrolase [Planococcus shenhongbingii]|uniref:NUDIX hydrolase n=1 Tax=Planococcus shenhongbingii TaxID=3058398 RepID=A0ABT8NHL2_9BACL|nr:MULTISPECIES: NUDIX hydrolase [unclassified Planococcus (in: firmicutes)]MDN7247219.1 NUDIX hydrolase [Planococcus sp. N017]WKA59756.1 NUDIX hydrolase [Planococcus sp. N016]